MPTPANEVTRAIVPVRVSIMTVALILLAVALYRWRLELASGLIPFLQIMVELCEHRFDVEKFNVLTGGNELLFSLRLTAAHPVQVFGNRLPGMDVSATTLVTHLLLDLWIYGAVLSAGIALTPMRITRLIPVALAGCCLLCWLDIPLVLLGSIEGLLAEHLAPDQLASNPLVWWTRFLSGGGRMVLALGLGLGVLALGTAPDESACPP